MNEACRAPVSNIQEEVVIIVLSTSRSAVVNMCVAKEESCGDCRPFNSMLTDWYEGNSTLSG
jgi:hypothetical protein